MNSVYCSFEDIYIYRYIYIHILRLFSVVCLSVCLFAVGQMKWLRMASAKMRCFCESCQSTFVSCSETNLFTRTSAGFNVLNIQTFSD